VTAFLTVGLAAFGVALLTLFSGFGLGTLLMPVFALFFPVEVAVASTAVVHAANNVFKVGLLARGVPGEVVLRFGVPALLASVAGAFVLTSVAELPAIASWSPFGRTAEITPVKLVMGLLILGFAAFELAPGLRSIRAPLRWLPVGGAISGFFGGLSGHQGALRAVFLTPLELSPAQFAATQAVLGLIVDAARLVVYGWSFLAVAGGGDERAIPWPLVATAVACAFAGSLLGKRLLPKVTIEALRGLVGVLLVLVRAGLALGLV